MPCPGRRACAKTKRAKREEKTCPVLSRLPSSCFPKVCLLAEGTAWEVCTGNNNVTHVCAKHGRQVCACVHAVYKAHVVGEVGGAYTTRSHRLPENRWLGRSQAHARPRHKTCQNLHTDRGGRVGEGW